ncbi:hypothetical protein [Vibrio sp. 10N]|uniref:hypothetical protein n=1 Tax=Vibrio sp. 10N TaxID=3058938 RepID=UPI0028147382|nr:hypothetical protein VB10N_46870 [Vibrio sp. 10N]
MIPDNLALLPANNFQRAVALTYTDMAHRTPRGATPFANSFCRHYFGYKPRRQELLVIADNRSDKVPEIMHKLDRFLRSNGQQRYLVSTYFADQAFPSIATSARSRSENHMGMRIERDNKIYAKATLDRQSKLNQMKTDMLSLSPKDLPEFISNNDTQWHEYELKQCLKTWYNANVSNGWRFDDLYSELSASRTALDLSFGD